MLARKKVPITEVAAQVLDKNAQAIGEKIFYHVPNDQLLGSWIVRPKANKENVVPLKKCSYSSHNN
jgi:hypothetical protein